MIAKMLQDEHVQLELFEDVPVAQQVYVEPKSPGMRFYLILL